MIFFLTSVSFDNPGRYKRLQLASRRLKPLIKSKSRCMDVWRLLDLYSTAVLQLRIVSGLLSRSCLNWFPMFRVHMHLRFFSLSVLSTSMSFCEPKKSVHVYFFMSMCMWHGASTCNISIVSTTLKYTLLCVAKYSRLFVNFWCMMWPSVVKFIWLARKIQMDTITGASTLFVYSWKLLTRTAHNNNNYENKPQVSG